MTEIQGSRPSSITAEVLLELKRIRKGLGLADSARQDLIGPHLSGLCGILTNDSPEAVTSKVVQTLSGHLSCLEKSEAEAVSAALGIGGDFGGSDLLGKRIGSLAGRLGVEERTARRRIDDALQAFAEHITNGHEAPSLANAALRGWHFRTVRTVVLVGKDGLEVLEFRTVVSDASGLRTVKLGVSVPSPGGDAELPQKRLLIDALYGGDIVMRHMATSARTEFELELPRSLNLGEIYEYGIRFRLPADVQMLPYYVLVPLVMCEEFDLRMKFGPLPAKVELLSGVFQSDATDSVLGVPAIEIDALGELHAKFRQLQPGLAYGVRWLNE